MSTKVHETYATGLRLSHAALLRNLDRFVEIGDRGFSASTADLRGFVLLYGRFLDVHHKSEDDFLFPALRTHAPLRTTDAAHLDRWSAEHRDIHVLGQELSQAAARLDDGTSPAAPERGPHPTERSLRALSRVSKSLRDVLAPHVASEEAILTPQHLAEMIPEQELEATVRS